MRGMTQRTFIKILLPLLAVLGGVASGGSASAAASAPVGTATAPARPAYADPRAQYTNGCTLSPDGIPGFYNFRDICNRHDICYARYPDRHHQYGSDENGRYTCDALFLNEMTNYCANRFGRLDPRRYTCYNTAASYYTAVRNLGRPFYYDYNLVY